jgi:hypothetical protein
MATLKNTTINDTGFVQLPVGTTAQRPGSPVNGDMRFNSESKVVEHYSNGSWKYMPPIVENGLVLRLDAAEPASYPGSGTTWTDLSGSGNNGTLTNGPTFNSSNGGSIVFDGVNDYVTNGNTDFSIANNLFADANGSWTVSAWFKFPVTPAGTRTGNASWAIVGRAGGIATAATFVLFVGSATDTTYGPYAPYKCACVVRGSVTIISSSSVNDNVWHNAVVTWNGTFGKVYFDGVETGNLGTGGAAVQTSQLNIGTTNNADVQAFEGNISSALIYNRALTALEIQQNFNALRGRYGI